MSATERQELNLQKTIDTISLLVGLNQCIGYQVTEVKIIDGYGR
ncbi:MAG: hypothetical protein ACLVJY_04785 [Frisingicoccus sp.]